FTIVFRFLILYHCFTVWRCFHSVFYALRLLSFHLVFSFLFFFFHVLRKGVAFSIAIFSEFIDWGLLLVNMFVMDFGISFIFLTVCILLFLDLFQYSYKVLET